MLMQKKLMWLGNFNHKECVFTNENETPRVF